MEMAGLPSDAAPDILLGDGEDVTDDDDCLGEPAASGFTMASPGRSVPPPPRLPLLRAKAHPLPAQPLNGPPPAIT